MNANLRSENLKIGNLKVEKMKPPQKWNINYQNMKIGNQKFGKMMEGHWVWMVGGGSKIIKVFIGYEECPK